jgi:hypothetical protein
MNQHASIRGTWCPRRDRWFVPLLRLPLLLVAAALMLPVPVLAQNNSVEAMLRGRVVDEVSELGIPGVHVEYLDAANRVRFRVDTDSEGNFLLSKLPTGSFKLRVTRLGFVTTTTPAWKIGSGEVLTVTVRMHHSITLLAPLEVTARVRSQSAVLARFYSRLDMPMGGTMLRREDIESRNATRITEVLETVPGLRVGSAPGFNAGGRTVSLGAGSPSGTACVVQIWLDGNLANRGNQNISIDELASPGILEGIEVYRGLSTIPPEFLTPDARCGVIALWTRRGD